MLVSALVIELGRMEDVEYSASYFDAGLVLVTGIKDIREMTDMASRTVAVEVAAEGDAIARKWARRVADLDVLVQETAEDALQSVLDGNADAALVGGIEARLFIRENPSLTIVSDPITNELYSVVVRADDKELLRAIDNALESMNKDGTMDSIMASWF
jgi:polar amino acid transport system substrate-binding protein